MTNMWDENAKERETSHRSIILKMLREAGDKGVTNIRLKEVTFRFGQSIHALYQKGYVITTTNLGDGVCRYTLLSEPEIEKEANKERAIDILASEVDKHYSYGVTGDTLITLIEKLGFDVKRKKGYYTQNGVV